MKRFACGDVIPGCGYVVTGAGDQSVLDQTIAHVAAVHGLINPPMSLVELVIAHTHPFTPVRRRGHLRLVDPTPDRTRDAAGEGHPSVAAVKQRPAYRSLTWPTSVTIQPGSSAWREFTARHTGPVHGIGGPIWAGRPAEFVERANSTRPC